MMGQKEDTDLRLAQYFIHRALELVEEARHEIDPERKLRLEVHALRFWEAARAGVPRCGSPQ